MNPTALDASRTCKVTALVILVTTNWLTFSRHAFKPETCRRVFCKENWPLCCQVQQGRGPSPSRILKPKCNAAGILTLPALARDNQQAPEIESTSKHGAPRISPFHEPRKQELLECCLGGQSVQICLSHVMEMRIAMHCLATPRNTFSTQNLMIIGA